MKNTLIHILLLASVLLFFVENRIVVAEVIGARAANEACTGRIELWHSKHKITIDADNLRKRNKNKRQIRKKMNGVYVPFQYANCSSTCSWKLQSKPHGGHELQIMTLDGMKYAGWAIKSVILTDD